MSEFDLDKILKLLDHANQQGINLAFENEELSVRFQKGKNIDKKFMEELKLNKLFLVHYFKTYASNGSTSRGIRLQKTERTEIEEIPLSFAQERLWFIDKLEGSVQYHLPAVLLLNGKLDIEALKYAIQQIINRHEVLRTVISEKDGKASQQINPEDAWQLNTEDGAGYLNDNAGLQAYIQQLIHQPFDLSKDYMIRANLLVLGGQSHMLVVTLHHIASDGWSTAIMVRELVELYNGFEKGRENILPPLDIQYADFAAWQRKYLQGDLLNQKLTYWKNKLQHVETLKLPIDYDRPLIQSNRGDAIRFDIDHSLTEQVLQLCQQQGTTFFMTLLAVFNVLLNRYTGQDDICVGTPIAGRDQQEAESLIGFFINSLALRNDLGDDMSFIDFLKKVKKTTLEAYDHKELPFEKVVEAVVSERDPGRSPVFQVMFVLQNLPHVPQLRLGDVELSMVNFDNFTSKYDLAFVITETGNGMECVIRYCTDLFKETTILRLADHFKNLLTAITKDPLQSIRSLPLISALEQHQLLVEFNDATADYSKEKTIIDVFESQVTSTPAAIAVVFNNEQLTYAQLNERSNQLARFLQAKNMKAGAMVAIGMERSPDMLVAIIGILKAGGAYVPVDMTYPAHRIRFMLDDTSVKIFLTSEHDKHVLAGNDKLQVISMDIARNEIKTFSTANLLTSINTESIAYIIYTSGSTGTPKGVMVKHSGVVNLAANQATALQLTPQTTTLQFASIGFDASCYEIFNTFLSGGRLVLPRKEDLLTAENFEELIIKNSIDLAVLPPTFLHVIKDKLGTLKTIVSAGEALKVGIAREIQSKGIRLINAYGPTENTVCTTFSDKPIHEGNVVVIGKPVSNVQVYILDKFNQMVPVNIAGELCIAGTQLAHGYLNQPVLTQEKFILNPFDISGKTHLYKSGDLARWLPDGNIEYMGRIDDQVKLRGYRIELGEIESCLLQSGLVNQVVVLLREDLPDARRLAGYVITDKEFEREAVITYLESKLPEYMIPLVWVVLERFPLTPNGKIDKKQLPVPGASASIQKSYEGARNQTEEQLTTIWKELLHVQQVGIHDNFFELGGDSILTIQVVSKARRLGLILQPKDLFLYQTVGKLSSAIAERSGALIVGEQGILTGLSGLLPIQQWWLQMEPADTNHFNQSVLLGLNKSITASGLQQAMEVLMDHHDALRFKYYLQKGEWKQEYGNHLVTVISEDLQYIPDGQLASVIAGKSAVYQQSLHIEAGELVTVVWMQTPSTHTHNRLLIVVHHLAVDGVSWRILLSDLELLLNGSNNSDKIILGPKSTSMRQWYLALESWRHRSQLLSQLNYWRKAANNYYPLPVDKIFSDTVRVKNIKQYSVRLGIDQTTLLLQEVPRVYRTEINDLLLAALAETISEWTGMNNVNIGFEGHGREDITTGVDTSRTVGWFTSLYPLRLDIPTIKGEADMIKSVKEQLRQVPSKGLGYGVLKYINKEPSLQGTEPWDIVFNYLGQLDNVVSESSLFVAAGESQGAGQSGEQQVVEKMIINSSVRGGQLILNWNYSNEHYDESTIEKLSAAYLFNLGKLIEHCIGQQNTRGIVFTPADFGLAGEIGYTELDQFLKESVNGVKRKDAIEGLYRLSGLQEGMLFHGLYDEKIGAYMEQFGCELFGVEIETLRKSWAQMIKWHSILRSAFYVDDLSVPVQCVYREVELPVIILDYRDMAESEQLVAIKEFDEADKDLGFDFKAAPLMRLAIFRLSDERFRMLWTSHHILFDGWSFPILMEEFLTTYELLESGGVPVNREEDRYEDYIRYIEQADKEQEEQYWRKYLQGVEQNTLLPFITGTTERNKGKGNYHAIGIHLDTSKAAIIQSFAQRNRITLNTIMQGVWSYLLHRYTGNKNIVFGIIVSGRPDDLNGIEKRVGMYINTLALHSAINEELGIVEWLQAIQAEQVQSRQYQHIPLPLVQGWSGVQGDLFDTLLTFENYPISQVVSKKKWALKVGKIDMQDHTNYPLSIVIGSSDYINIRFSYNSFVLEEKYVKEIRDHFEHVLLQLVASGDKKIGNINLLTPAEQQQLLAEFNDTKAESAKAYSIIEVFEAQVAKNPEATAIVFNDEAITYQELNDRANQLANYLRSKGVAAETPVPICINGSLDMMVGILGILKAGGAYVPIDPEFPQERIHYILEDTSASVVVTNAANRALLTSNSSLEIIELDGDLKQINQQPADNPNHHPAPDHLAYIIYTSGSTGRPKGVMIEHGSLLSYSLNAKTDYIGTSENNTGSYIHLSYTFDASITALFMPLLNGKMVVIGSKQSLDIFEDANLLKYAPYDFIKITPAHLELIFPKFIACTKCLLTEKLVIGGEALHPGQFDSFTANGINVEVINEYGPTEATVGCTTFSFNTVSDRESIQHGISIGKPIGRAVIYIIDDQSRLVPVGVKGEICIGGAGVARGYLNRPEQTAERFVMDPFSGEADTRMYKTGDIGRWLPTGNIEYMGRVDDQVKIRGYRIELGEVEQVLQSCEPISQGVVLAKAEKDGSKRLVSYFVPVATAVKEKERELNFQRVASWKELYEVEYGQTENDENIDPEFNVIGWNDSFTGGVIPAGEMKEWLNDIVEVVLADNPGNVLEVGCGTGLIYYQLAGKVKKYIGCDLSRSSINQIKQHISKGLRDYGETELFTAPAHEVAVQPGQQVDTILLNSMVQYFPGEDYMNLVLEKCMNILNGQGRIIIGDVRDNRLLDLFKARLRMQKLQDAVSVKEFNWGLGQDIIKEEELCFDPAYFYNLKNKYPEITHVEIFWKQGDYINELSLYRFTVVIYVGIERNVVTPTWEKWNELADKKNIFSGNRNQQGIKAISSVPNPRLGKEKLLDEALQNKSLKTVGEIMQVIENASQETMQVKQLIQTAASNGYHQKQLLSEDAFLVNLLFEYSPSNAFVLPPTINSNQQANIEVTNIPLFTDISFLLQKAIRETMLNSLPDYMVPSEFTALRQLPLTSNGKVDRVFLSQREERIFVNTLNYLPPSTDLEKSIAQIWKELLHLERVGIEDNFFELGGHSLLAMRVIAAIRKELEVELNIKELFIHPTIGLLARHIQKLSKGLLLPAIEKVKFRPDLIPLSFSQERLWFIHQLDGSLQYHIPAVLRLKGALDKAALEGALQQIVYRHEVLRTVIVNEAGQGYQRIRPTGQWRLSIADGTKFLDDISSLQQHIGDLVKLPFDLSNDDMLRATLVTLSEADHLLVATLHHIASDGWSSSILVNELAEFYNALVEKRTASLPILPIQYADFAIWQRTNLQGDAWDKKLSYWKEKLNDVATLDLPVDYQRPLVQSTRGAITSIKLEKELSDQLQSFSQQHGTTMFMTLLTTFNVLLYRYTGQTDICVGTPIAGRQQQETEGLIGFFVNTLALRNELNGNAPFKDLLQQVKLSTLDAYDHQEVPFEKVVELVVKERDMSRSPLFQVVFALQNTPEMQEIHLGELQLSRGGILGAGRHSTTFELSFIVTETVGGLNLAIEYCTDLFDGKTILKMANHFKNLLQSILHSPQQSIGALHMLEKVEMQHLLVDFNDTKTVFPFDKTVVALFEEQVALNPDAIALVFGNEKITYQQLNITSNQVAHFLKTKGVQNETLVPVCMKRSIMLVACLLGILKAGGAYVPIDSDYPTDRIAYMLEDTVASILLTTKDAAISLPASNNIEVIDMEIYGALINEQPFTNLETVVDPKQLAYVIYTSGSTGKPKGVLIEHKALANLICWHQQAFKVNASARATAMAGIGFDAFGWEVWPYLSCGASVFIIEDSTRINPPKLVGCLDSNNITHSFISTALVPDLVNEIGDKNICLQYLLTGGDKLPPIETLGLTYKLVNNYGPTENTVVTSYYELGNIDYQVPPIGKPISNTVIYLLNNQRQLVSEAATGEICIGGSGLARGYLNLPDLTAKQFISDSFSATPGEKLYRSGDLGRWLPDGNLEYLGRVDEQVKIRGFRVELGEIEQELQASGLVHQAIVLVKSGTDANKRLVGYVIPKDEFNRDALVDYLRLKLPDYMIPANWIVMDNFPLTNNGKINRKSLPDPDPIELLTTKYVAPRSVLEEKLVVIWKELLQVERVGINDNFFELGGHSLMAMRMVAYIEKSLLVTIPIKVLFQFTCIADLSKYLEIQSNPGNEENIIAYKLLDV